MRVAKHARRPILRDALSAFLRMRAERGFRAGPRIPTSWGCPSRSSSSIPHRLGKDEALLRIKAGLSRAEAELARLVNFEHQEWSGDRLSFRVSALGSRATGFLDVYEGAVRLEVTLPWLLAKFAHAAQRVIGQKGTLMLEKK